MSCAWSFHIAILPEDDAFFGPPDDIEQRDARQRGRRDRSKQRCRFEMRRGYHDEITEPLRRPDKLAHNRTYDSKRGRNFKRREQVWKTIWDAQLAEFLRPRSAERLEQLAVFCVRRFKPFDPVHQHREKAYQDHSNDLGPPARPQPDDQ